MIAANAISKHYGGQTLYENASFQINPGEKVGLVGPNGAGKTTVFRVIMGIERIDSGQISVPDKLVIGYFSQDVGEMKGGTPLEAVEKGSGRVSKLAHEIEIIEKKLQDSEHNPMSPEEMERLLEKYGEVQSEFDHLDGYNLPARAKEILTGLGIGPEDYDRPLESFSGGWKMRVALAQVLALNPDVLLIDEPTNHLDMESIVWLEEWLAGFKGAVVMTSHDRDFMNRLVSKIIEVNNKAITTYTGNYDYYEKERLTRLDQLLASHKRQQDMLAKEQEFIARFAARASHAAQVQSRVKKLEKIDRIEIPPEDKEIKFEFNTAPRSGNDVVKLTDLAKTWTLEDGRTRPVFSGVTGLVRRLERVAVVGVNGAGKSTLLKVIAGQTEPSSGKVEIGAGVSIGYFSQNSLDSLKQTNTVMEEVQSRVPNATIGSVRSLLGAFLFSGDDADKKVSVLSGGERSRVLLATILANPVNLLILDEPTNHLDIKSREVLMSALQKFEGTTMIVSHDRHFLRHLVNRVFEVDHGALRIYEGDFEYYLTKAHRFGH